MRFLITSFAIMLALAACRSGVTSGAQGRKRGQTSELQACRVPQPYRRRRAGHTDVSADISSSTSPGSRSDSSSRTHTHSCTGRTGAE